MAATLVLEHLREEYKQGRLDESTSLRDPFEQFRQWLEEARAAQLKEPNAFSLATATPDGKPSVRIVLLKEVAADGIVFYSNYTSRKGREMEDNARVSALFYWGELERQIRVEGDAERVSRAKSERYFNGRPKGSRLGALASHQSDVISGRQVLEDELHRLEDIYKDRDDVPTPEWWGGYLIRPHLFEFWQGRENRLHDRLVYRSHGRAGEINHWSMERLAP